MAQKAGAALWHMWHVHGSYGFRVPEMPVAIRTPFGGLRDEYRKMPWIAVDRFGRRFMNEWPPACADTPIRELEYYNANIQDYPRVPCYLIFDEEGRKLGSIASPKFNDAELSRFSWSDDNLAELEKGYIYRSDTIEGIAQHWNLSPKALCETVKRWNAWCEEASDEEHGRPSGTMMPLENPPFYSIDAWPIISNTQGGPVYDDQWRVLDPYDQPIPRLYEAGELGAIWGHLYMLSGNIAECFIGGWVAGCTAAAEERWC